MPDWVGWFALPIIMVVAAAFSMGLDWLGNKFFRKR